ncbi:hypothetical protein SBC1_66390 (plasmid) [Caballeronia sp. SBC1]|uniref:DUF4148 domain-containing protein n=1 Tax=unclassified Caballeronia TaxID=2646786 RepID=UPI0013E15963|nr:MULTISPECIES: DUF4148 domain-containing protein [unclassified Caballeronia]QIE28536.1 hypothetical protein SBC2_66120 [Caballeronia sp. SBC2]QIN66592.1 hypothetical protein SBC1_66390 [Caballeronia sp. SBC1]
MPRVRVASITVLASLGIVLGAASDAFSQSTDTTPAAPSPASPTLKQMQKAQRKADRKAARAKNTAELSKLEKNGYNPADDRSDYPDNLRRAQEKANGQ